MRIHKRLALGAFHALGLHPVRIRRPPFIVVGRRADYFNWAYALELALQEGHVAQLLKQYRVNCVLDVGANTGQFGRALRRAGYHGRIVSFEPLREPYGELLRLASSDPDWLTYRLALGSAPGEREMMVTSASELSSFLPPNEYAPQLWSMDAESRFDEMKQPVGTERVEVRRLDSLLDEVTTGLPEPRALLKMDTQGYDLEVFAGLGERTEHVVALQSELSVVPIYEGMPHITESLRVYESRGFEIAGFFPVTRDRETLRVVEYDCTMVRPETLERRTA